MATRASVLRFEDFGKSRMNKPRGFTQGAQGCVLFRWHPKYGEVVLKRTPITGTRSVAERRARAELVFLILVNHPFVEGVHGSFEHEVVYGGESRRYFYIVLERADGTLLDVLRDRVDGDIDPDDCHRENFLLISQLILGTQCAHALNIVHGDLKPSNVLLFKGTVVQLADFGASFNSLTRELACGDDDDDDDDADGAADDDAGAADDAGGAGGRSFLPRGECRAAPLTRPHWHECLRCRL
jgi:serine/threonine protein kinase